MFSVVNAVLLRPLPYANADRVATLWSVFTGPQALSGNPHGLIAYQEYREIVRQSSSFDGVALWFSQSINLTGVNEPQRLVGSFVTGSFFAVLNLRAERGRLFTEEDSAPNTVKPYVVISHELWQQRFEGQDSAIGETMTLNGVPLTVIGVLAPPFDVRTVPSDGWFVGYDVFIPTAQFPARTLDTVNMLSVARIKPGVTFANAQADLDVIARRLQTQFPQTNTNRTIIVEPAHESIIGQSRTALFLLLGAVGAVLLIACLNVSNLLLARAIDRQREIALARRARREPARRHAADDRRGGPARRRLDDGRAARRPLGARRADDAAAAARGSHPAADCSRHDGAAVHDCGGDRGRPVCGLAPAVRTSRPDLSRVLQAGFRRGSATGSRTRDIVVAVEVALSVTLVAICGLLVQSLLAVQRAPLGFDPSNVFTLEFRLPQSKFTGRPEDIARFFQQAIERVRAVPGIQSAALVRAVPFSGNWGNTRYTVEGRTPPPKGSEPLTRYHIVTPDSFKTLRIPLVRGRDFTDRDDLAAPHVAIINETFARTAFAGDDPIGRHITSPDAGPEPLTIVGIVGDTKHLSSTEPPQPQLYVPHYQFPLDLRVAGRADVRFADGRVERRPPGHLVGGQGSTGVADASARRDRGHVRRAAAVSGRLARRVRRHRAAACRPSGSTASCRTRSRSGRTRSASGLALGASGQRVLRRGRRSCGAADRYRRVHRTRARGRGGPLCRHGPVRRAAERSGDARRRGRGACDRVARGVLPAGAPRVAR